MQSEEDRLTKLRECGVTWKRNNPEKVAYMKQKHHAKTRDIDFLFTYEEWLAWWGDDYNMRGTTADELCMARLNDTGSYEPSNVYKTTNSGNTKDQLALRWNG